MSKEQIALPLMVPPEHLGASWTGKSLLNWNLEHMDNESKVRLLIAFDKMGGDAFRAFFNEQAANVNKRAGTNVFFCASCGKIVSAPGLCVGCFKKANRGPVTEIN